jgi:hypothetical protein
MMITTFWELRVAFFKLFTDAICIQTLRRRIVGDRWTMNWKRFGRKRLWHDCGTILESFIKTRKPSVRLVGVPAEIRTEHFPNASLEPNFYVNLSAELCDQVDIYQRFGRNSCQHLQGIWVSEGGTRFLKKAGKCLPGYTASQTRRPRREYLRSREVILPLHASPPKHHQLCRHYCQKRSRLLRQFAVGLTPPPPLIGALTIGLLAVPQAVTYIAWEICNRISQINQRNTCFTSTGSTRAVHH